MLVAALTGPTVAVWGALDWVSAVTDKDLNHAEIRDEVLDTGRDHVARLTTMDHHDIDTGLRRWLDVTTGALHSELSTTGHDALSTVERARTVATGTVSTAALTELDIDAGTATLVASGEVTTVRDGAPPVSARNRYRVELRDTDSGWKVHAFQRVPVGGGG